MTKKKSSRTNEKQLSYPVHGNERKRIFGRYAEQVKKAPPIVRRELFKIQKKEEKDRAKREAQILSERQRPVLQRIISTFSRGGATRQLYGTNYNLRGRPKGSLDRRYAKYGGVYGFRKVQSAQLRQQRIQQARNAQLSPQERQIISNMRNQNQQYPVGYDYFDKLAVVSHYANLPREDLNVEKSLQVNHAVIGDNVAFQIESQLRNGDVD